MFLFFLILYDFSFFGAVFFHSISYIPFSLLLYFFVSPFLIIFLCSFYVPFILFI
jgi:hypothetical protein